MRQSHRKSASGCCSWSGRAASGFAQTTDTNAPWARVISHVSETPLHLPDHRPPCALFSCGNRPSSRPVMNTAVNSRALAACTVINWTASWPACALVVARFERGMRQKASQRRHGVGVLRRVGRRCRVRARRCRIVSGGKTAGREDENRPRGRVETVALFGWTKAAAALTSSCGSPWVLALHARYSSRTRRGGSRAPRTRPFPAAHLLRFRAGTGSGSQSCRGSNRPCR